ncbi:hypothetical protein EV426DRAFT_706982 [Tirmania nivea]|nr:hypothetical protein EV426DRAFT_706982 [Tirmania nivea]
MSIILRMSNNRPGPDNGLPASRGLAFGSSRGLRGFRTTSTLRTQVIEASTSESPLARFFRTKGLLLGGPTYAYRSLATEQEFTKLSRLLQQNGSWMGKTADDELQLSFHSQTEQKALQKKFQKSPEYRELRRELNRAIEDELDWLLSRNEQVKNGLQPWEYLCEVFKVGKAPMTRLEAKKVLRPIKVNIYDFIEYERNVQRGTKPQTPKRFKTDSELGKYSKKKGRVYALEDAKEDGVLRLLLRRIFRFLALA